jgi:tetratricopeptide (TPR) repeat protein
MKKLRILLLTGLILATLGGSVSAQMDMLPQIFRDLPPELKQGLPEEMSYEEYRELSRNVDFFTMFMSMWVPGYGLFQVERPGLAWGIVGARTVGYGMMAAALYRQWDDMEDLGRLASLGGEEFDAFLLNSLLFGSGVVINGMGWAADVLGAYHIAKWEEDFVIYKYGLRTALGEGEAEERDIEYIRKLVLQDDPYVEDDLLRELRRYTAAYPDGAHRDEAEFYLGTAYAGRNNDARALLHCARVFLFHPDSGFAEAARRHAVRLLHRNRSQWEEDRERLMAVIRSTPGKEGAPSGELFSRYLERFARFRTPEFRELFVEEARHFAMQYEGHGFADDALWTAAEVLSNLGRYEDAVITLTELAFRFPDSEYWAKAVFQAGVLLEEQLDAGVYAESFFERVLEEQPQSEAAEKIRAWNR